MKNPNLKWHIIPGPREDWTKQDYEQMVREAGPGAAFSSEFCRLLRKHGVRLHPSQTEMTSPPKPETKPPKKGTKVSENEKPVDPTELSPETAKNVQPQPEEPKPEEPTPEEEKPEDPACPGENPCPGPHTVEEPAQPQQQQPEQ